MRYAISDIHGCAKTFRKMVEEVLQLKPTDTLFLLGDYIDRGLDSKGVIDFILELRANNFTVECLAGNHEEMMMEAYSSPELVAHWIRNGGQETLLSFEVTAITKVPTPYWEFFDNLKTYIALEDYLLVHAGFNFAAPDPFKDTHAMLWIRNFAIDKQILGNRKIIHGHTPIPAAKIAATIKDSSSDIINIDGGCVYNQLPLLGNLTALNLDTLELHVVPSQDPTYS